MRTILSIVITIALLGMQHFLGERKAKLAGGILPVLFLIFAIVVFATGRMTVTVRNIFSFLVLEAILCSIWEEASVNRKKKNLKR